MRCIALSQAHRITGGEAEKRAQKHQERGGENWRVWNNTYWERNWKKWEGQSSIHSYGSLNCFVLGDIHTRQDSSYHQEDFPQHFAHVHHLLQPALPLQSRLKSLSHLLILFYINGLEHRPHWTAPSLWFLRWFSSFQQHSTQFVVFSEAFWVLNWEGWAQKRKGLKITFWVLNWEGWVQKRKGLKITQEKTFEVFLFHKSEKKKMSQRKAPIQNRFIPYETAFHKANFKGH